MSRKKPQAKQEPMFNVDVWNTEGDVVKHFRDVSADEVDNIREQYADDPWLTVVVEETL